MTYQECVDYILSVPLFASKLGTENLYHILELMEHPENSYKMIHVAGTNGKGSTCSFLASILQCAGKKVGLFTSPHLVKINERIRINDKVISDEELVNIFNRVMEYVELAKKQNISHPSFFEFVFLMGVLYFKSANVDYVILETGMGGRLDATNVVTPVLSVITSVAMDHMQFLGDSIEKIAFEKAGIIKSGIPVIFFDRKDVATPVIVNKCKKEDASLQVVEKKQYILLKITKKNIDFSFNSGYHKYEHLKIKRTALFQVENAMLAVKAYEVLLIQSREHKKVWSYDDTVTIEDFVTGEDEKVIEAGLLQMMWPCRMEEIAEHVYVDGAHNEEAINAFCESLEVLFPSEKKKLLFAVSKDKDYETMIKRLCRISFDEIILVCYEGNRSAELEIVKDTFKQFSSSKIIAFKDIRAGFSYGKNHVEDQYLFCVGSLYLAGDLLKLENKNDKF